MHIFDYFLTPYWFFFFFFDAGHVVSMFHFSIFVVGCIIFIFFDLFRCGNFLPSFFISFSRWCRRFLLFFLLGSHRFSMLSMWIFLVSIFFHFFRVAFFAGGYFEALKYFDFFISPSFLLSSFWFSLTLRFTPICEIFADYFDMRLYFDARFSSLIFSLLRRWLLFLLLSPVAD